MNKEEIISVVKEYVKNKCYNDSTGHDWWHIQRVYNNAMLINKKEEADEFIITIIVLMHDLYDHKFYNGNIAGKPIYDPNNSELVNEEEYKQKGSKTSIGHFYDKLLNIKNLYVNAGNKEILKGLNFKINKGEIHVIMGPNGARKSTLAKII